MIPGVGSKFVTHHTIEPPSLLEFTSFKVLDHFLFPSQELLYIQ